MKYVKLVDFLDHNEGALLNEWELRVRSKLSASEATASLVLRDHLVKLIDDLKGYLYELSLGGGESSRVRGYLNAAVEDFEIHGRERAATRNYAEDQVMWEIIILRRVIMEGLTGNRQIDADLSESLNRFFEELYCSAIAAFSESIKHTQRKIIASLVHDIRNPLSTIEGSCQLLERKKLPEDTKRLILAMQYGVRRVSAILTEVLDSANIEAGKGLNFVFRECNFTEQIAILTRESEMVYGSRFKYEINSPSKEIRAILDPAMVVRLLENLISNAFKHGSSEGDVNLKIEDRNDELVMTVHNWGKPIPADKREEIFEYLSTTKGGSAEKKGWGIGLSMAKATAEGHKGSVQIESDQKKGTSFILTLPKFSRKPEETLTIII